MTTAIENTETPETLAAEIVECWTSQAATGELMIIGTADDMGVLADFEHVPEDMWDEVEALVREGFEAHNAGIIAATPLDERLDAWLDGDEQGWGDWDTRIVEHVLPRCPTADEILADDLGYVAEQLGVSESDLAPVYRAAIEARL